MAFIELRHSFDKTNFDLEDSSPAGGPINAPNNGHQQIYTPQNKFKDSPEGDKSTGLLKDEGFDGIEGLDLENNGPKNVPLYNHNQNYTPTDTFKDSPEGQLQGGNLKTNGFSGNPLVPNTGFLDLENNGPTNVANYNHQQTWTPTDTFKDSPEGQLQGGNLKTDGFSGNPAIPGTGFLDLENNGPTNVANYNHQQTWTPTDKFIESEQGSRTGGKLYPTSDPTIATFTNAFNGNLDLENNDPASVGISGGGKEGFTPKYTPKSGQGYEDSPQGKLRSPDSAAEKNNFKTSGLDLESSEAGIKQGGEGGPNRTNAIQTKNPFQSGQYITTRAGGPGFGGNDIGGEIIKQTLHRYTPKDTYLDNTPIQTSANFTPKNNIAVAGEANGFDATLK